MCELTGHSWELNTKPLRTIYQGLATKTTLTSLTLKFPTTRAVRPIVLIPPLPSLTFIHLIGMDPLCFPDDVSVLFANARKLQDLKLEWSPRMIQEKEPVELDSLFGRCASSDTKLPVKRLAIKNLYAPSNSVLNRSLDLNTVESVTVINCGNPEEGTTQFHDDSWILQNGICLSYRNFKKYRVDRLDRQTRLPLAEFSNFEEIYFVSYPPSSTNAAPDAVVKLPPDPMLPDQDTPMESTESPSERLEIGSNFLAAIITRHGATLKKLLLPDQWCLSADTLKVLLKSCPKLRQLGIALDGNNFDIFRNLIHLVPELRAVRILIRPDEPVYKLISDIPADYHTVPIGLQTWHPKYKNLKWFGIGTHCFELGGVSRVGAGKQFTRKVVAVTREQIEHVEIFGMDCADI
jgi:hypothetical protein